MRRIFVLLSAAALLFALAMGVSGATGATSVGSYTTVSSDGSCQVTLTATLHLEQVSGELTFPIPAGAANVTLNGSRVRAPKNGTVRNVELSGTVGKVIGDFSINIHYTLSDVIQTTDSGSLQLQLPILSGFAYPVADMSFSVTLPGEITGAPSFSSGYHQSDIEKHMVYSVSGATISGSFREELKDHETLTMTLPVSGEMFPQPAVQLQSAELTNWGMGICAALAFLYWLIFLRNLPPRRRHCAEPPEGYSAGELGCVLSVQGADLGMMVFSWAQLGYILIQIDRHDRVLLHKRMDMGNERGSFERGCFRKLFGKRQLIDTSGYHYAELSRAVGKKKAKLQELMHPASGNLAVFRVLASGIGLFGGIWMGQSLSGGAALEGLVLVLLAAAGAVSAWTVLGWAGSLFLRHRGSLWAGLGCCGAWLLLSILAGQLVTGIWIAGGLLLAGLMLAYGGRRTELGKQTMAQVLGLRRYLRTVPRAELQRICSQNPEYFHALAPYAMALGVGKAFARRFGGTRLPGCPYLTSGMDAHMTAAEWNGRMEYALGLMEARGRKMPMEKLMNLLGKR